MKLKQWGEEVWEEKIKTQGEIGVVGGSVASLPKLKKMLRETTKTIKKEFLPQIKPKSKILDCGVGQGLEEKGVNAQTGVILVDVDPHYFRPTEVDFLKGNGTKARIELGWRPKATFKELVRIMVETDLKLLEKER